jgi:tripartite-type tricarboxylate transporter receptor subunit TctC
MTLSRRQFLHLAAAAAPSRMGWAQAYPTRPVRIIVGAAGGSSPDIFGRLLGHWLSERMGRPFVIDNRPGAGGDIAFEAAARSPPDGYTLVLVTTSAAINATLYQ